MTAWKSEVQAIATGKSALVTACVAAALALLLSVPALWNGYALLQFDTGGYLARWYEGYLVPSRSTVMGLYLHLGETSHFWINITFQALVTVWVIRLVATRLSLTKNWQLTVIVVSLCLTTALPFLVSLLLTDIFTGLAVLALYLLAFHGRSLSKAETIGLIVLAGFSAATHSATMAVMLALCVAGWAALPLLRNRILTNGLAKAGLATMFGAIALVLVNYQFSGQMAWTPGGAGIAFGRMLQDGIVTRYLHDHCPDPKLKLCAYRDELPKTADEFFWGHTMFDKLGGFDGLGEEMQTIAVNALVEYPLLQFKTAAKALFDQLVMVATGEGTHNKIWHTYGIFERFLPDESKIMRMARQQQGQLDFSMVNRIHVPVALISLVLMMGYLFRAAWTRRLDELTILASVTFVAILSHAFVCGVISGPHDRYGARITWLATFTVIVVALRMAERASQSEPDHGPAAALS